MAGYTTYHNLGFESIQESAIARGLTPSPRLFAATHVIASTGSYKCRTENATGGYCVPAQADAADGVEGCRAAVRRRIAAGADAINFFTDYWRRIMCSPPAQQHQYIASVLHLPKDPNPDYMVFSQAEMDVIVAEATLAGCPVSAHASGLDGAVGAIEAGVTSIEHAYFTTEKMLKRGLLCLSLPKSCMRIALTRSSTTLNKPTNWYAYRLRRDTGTYSHG